MRTRRRPTGAVVTALARQWVNLLRKATGLRTRGLVVAAGAGLLVAAVWNVALARLTHEALASPGVTDAMVTPAALDRFLLSQSLMSAPVTLLLLATMPSGSPLELAVALHGGTRRTVMVAQDVVILLASALGALVLGEGCGLLIAATGASSSTGAASYAWVFGALLSVGALVLWRGGHLLATTACGLGSTAGRAVGAALGTLPIGLVVADVVRASTANTTPATASWLTHTAMARAPAAALATQALAVAVLLATAYGLVWLMGGLAPISTGATGLAIARYRGECGRRGTWGALLSVEARSWVRHPIVVTNVLVLGAIAVGMGLLPEPLRSMLAAPGLVLLCSLSGVLAETAYGRTVGWSWLPRLADGRRGALLAPQLVACGLSGAALAAMSVLAVTHGRLDVAGLAFLGVCTVLAASVGWAAGVVVPYSDAAPGTAWVTTALTTTLLGGYWGALGLSHQTGSPGVVAASAAVVGGASVWTGLLVARWRDVERL
jgi:hypothetical protein